MANSILAGAGSRIPALPTSTRKHTAYNQTVRRDNIKYRPPSNSNDSLTTSMRSPVLTPSTSTHASPSEQALCTSDADSTIEKVSTPLSPPSTPGGRTPKAPPPDVTHNKADIEAVAFSSPNPLLRRAQALLHAELESLMQALHLSLRCVALTSPTLATSCVSAFEALAADTPYEGAGARIHNDVVFRAFQQTGGEPDRVTSLSDSNGAMRPSNDDARRQFAASLAAHLCLEVAKNTRRYQRGWNFRSEFDAQSMLPGVRSRKQNGDHTVQLER